MEKLRYSVHIEGVVQGVGFRPFFYNLAKEFQLCGFVRNETDGVYAEIEGYENQLREFLKALRERQPPSSKIVKMNHQLIQIQNDVDFQILPSQNQSTSTTLISPDLALCNDCTNELYQKDDRRYLYPFINCTNCGPRFTIVLEVPYDRSSTTMKSFQMCSYCHNEYINPSNRRFHAEPIACPVCGPRLEWFDKITQDRFSSDHAKTVISRATKILWQGGIIALKGLGGFHLACLATDDQVVKLLRKRKQRPFKPFAVMFRDLNTVKQYCEVSPFEEQWLLSTQKPILLLKKKVSPIRDEILFQSISENISPHLSEIGAMLPYTPLHSLLFEIGGFPALVMTSGNQSEEPIEIDNEQAVKHLFSIADGFLFHNREIWNRCDDSVGFVHRNSLVLTRRSRGFTPLPINYWKKLLNTFAVGAMYSNTFAISKGQQIYFSQHIGDVDNESTLEFLNESFQKLKKWLKIEPELIAYDLHPDLLTTHYAKQIYLDVPHQGIQHHFAHFASTLVSHGYNDAAIGVIFDGTGYGLDGKIWGGEFFFGDLKSIQRVGHLDEMPLLGGDTSIKKPYRIALSYLLSIDKNLPLNSFAFSTVIPPDEYEFIRHFIHQSPYWTATTSMGRLFDVVSSLLGVCYHSTYEGQAAIELEQLAWKYYHQSNGLTNINNQMDIRLENHQWVINPRIYLLKLLDAYLNHFPSDELAYQFHLAVSNCTLEIIDLCVEKYGRVPIAFGGGVFQNRLLIELLDKGLKKRNLIGLLPNEIPVNDGGLALGQIVLANESFHF